LDSKGLVIPDTIEKHQVGPEQDDKLLHKGNETECGSCYGAAPEDECCNTCDEVRTLYALTAKPIRGTGTSILDPPKPIGLPVPMQLKSLSSRETTFNPYLMRRLQRSVLGDWQVRAAYRRKGWGFTDPQMISQCAKEGFLEKLRAQEGEGCHMWGSLAVNKVIPPLSHSLHLNVSRLSSNNPIS